MPELTRLAGVAGSAPRGENVSIVTIIVLFKCMNKCTAKGATLIHTKDFRSWLCLRLQSDQHLQRVGGYSYLTLIEKMRGGSDWKHFEERLTRGAPG